MRANTSGGTGEKIRQVRMVFPQQESCLIRNAAAKRWPLS